MLPLGRGRRRRLRSRADEADGTSRTAARLALYRYARGRMLAGPGRSNTHSINHC